MSKSCPFAEQCNIGWKRGNINTKNLKAHNYWTFWEMQFIFSFSFFLSLPSTMCKRCRKVSVWLKDTWINLCRSADLVISGNTYKCAASLHMSVHSLRIVFNYNFFVIWIFIYVLKYVEIKILHYLIVISTLKGIWAEVTKQNKIQGFFFLNQNAC